MIKKFIASAIGLSALIAAVPASADLYEINMSDGSRVHIDTGTQIGKWIGAGINATFTGEGLSNFSLAVPEGGEGIRGADYGITLTPDSTFTRGGTTYFPTSVHPQRFKTGAATGHGDFGVMLWSYWGPAGCATCTDIGDYVVYANGWSSAVGSTTSGGTDVPEPGVMGLMGLGVLGMAFGRRRRTKVNLNMAPALA